jgi:hypothetical protein
VPKTSSGKIRRSAAKELYERGNIGPVQHALWWQILRLALSGVGPQINRFLRLLRETLYAAWWWAVLAGAFLLGSLAVLILPRIAWRWSALRLIGRATLAAMGVPVSTIGIDRIPSRGAMLVFNHSSYMDSLVLAAVLPGEPAIVAKRELSGQLIAGSLLPRLGIPFVERYDVSASLADAQALIALANQGRILVCAAISVEIGGPVMPSGIDFRSVLLLRDTARNVMLSRCREPDLHELIKPENQP